MPSDPDPPPPSASQRAPGAPGAPGVLRVLRVLVREVLLPAAVLVGLLAIAVALIEGPPLQQFLYAVF